MRRNQYFISTSIVKLWRWFQQNRIVCLTRNNNRVNDVGVIIKKSSDEAKRFCMCNVMQKSI